MANDPAQQLRDDTRQNCWLCDRERGELCHVHEPAKGDTDSLKPLPAWTVPVAEEL